MERPCASSEPPAGPVVRIEGRSLTPAGVVSIACDGARVVIEPRAVARVSAERLVVDDAVARQVPVYGVTTGLGSRVTEALPPEHLADVSIRTLMGRANAVGPPLPDEVVRAAMAVRINQMAGGGSGIQPAVLSLLVDMLNAGVVPEIPSQGSIGAGDLCQLAHLGLTVIGEGTARFAGATLPSAAALAAAGLAPAVLGAKDGLALCNSSALSAAIAALALDRVETLIGHAYAVVALSFEGFRANATPAADRVLAVHPAPGQRRAGRRLVDALAGGLLLEPGQGRRLQDPLSWRCVPQVHGAMEAAMDFAHPAVDAELNGSSDNPLVLLEATEGGAGGEIVSTGNFQCSTLALALDTVALALHQVAALSAARAQRFLAPGLTGLPANLSPHGPERSGFAPLTKVGQALMARIRHLAVPTYDDPRSGAEVEDNSTNATFGAERLAEMAELTATLLAVEALIAAQATELAAPARLGAVPARLLAAIRAVAPPLDDDRPCGPDVQAVAALLHGAGAPE